ncbi:MAG: hypothetical protein J7521_10585 [Caulobacter sp.]|nr:hypothetical protein [Caulobacter sp.]
MTWMIGLLATVAMAASAPETPPTRATAPAAITAPDCRVDREALLALDYEAFEHDMNGGWRPLGSVDGCEAAAADLLRDYRLRNGGAVAAKRIEHLSSLMRHESQLAAAAGQTGRAIALRRAARGSPAWENFYYDSATIAFLERDKAKLLENRAKLAALPKPEGHDEAVAAYVKKYGPPGPVWPPNLDAVDGLIACFDKPYAEAYSFACREKAAK